MAFIHCEQVGWEWEWEWEWEWKRVVADCPTNRTNPSLHSALGAHSLTGRQALTETQRGRKEGRKETDERSDGATKRAKRQSDEASEATK